MIAGLDELGAITLDGDPGLRAQLAVVVAGPAPSTAEQAIGAHGCAARPHRTRAAAGRGARHARRRRHGVCSAVRDDEADDPAGASTVDSAGSAGRRLALVLGPRRAARTAAPGDYGTGRGATRVPARAVAPDGG